MGRGIRRPRCSTRMQAKGVRMVCTLSNLNEDQLRAVRDLESELGRPLLAFSCFDLQPAHLDGESVQRIRRLERELGLSLLAVQNTS